MSGLLATVFRSSVAKFHRNQTSLRVHFLPTRPVFLFSTIRYSVLVRPGKWPWKGKGHSYWIEIINPPWYIISVNVATLRWFVQESRHQMTLKDKIKVVRIKQRLLNHHDTLILWIWQHCISSFRTWSADKVSKRTVYSTQKNVNVLNWEEEKGVSLFGCVI